MEKITIEMFVLQCKNCSKKIIGHTQNEVRSNMKRHKGSKGCVAK